MVGGARIGFSARVVVHEHDGIGGGHDSNAKDFARLGHGFIERTLRHQIVSFDAQLGIEDKHGDILHIGVNSGVVATCCCQYFSALVGPSILIIDSGAGHSRRLTTFHSLGSDFRRRALGGSFGLNSSSCSTSLSFAVHLLAQAASWVTLSLLKRDGTLRGARRERLA